MNGGATMHRPLSLLLRRTVRRADRQLRLYARRRTALLHHVGKLVGEQAVACRGAGGVLAAGEGDVAADSVGECVYRPRRRGGLSVGVHAHPAKIMAEARFERGACSRG